MAKGQDVGTWRVRIDWDQNYFANVHSDVTLDVVAMSARLGINAPDGEVASEGVANITLKDTEGKYAPENTNSILAGKLRVNLRVFIELWDPRDDTWQLVWSGFVTKYQPKLSNRRMRQTEVTAEQDIRIRQGHFSWDVYENVKAGEVISDLMRQNFWVSAFAKPAPRLGYAILGTAKLGIVRPDLPGNDPNIGYDPNKIDPGNFDFPVVGHSWEESKRGFWEAISNLAEAERGFLWIDAKGDLVFYDRLHYLKNPGVRDVLDLNKDAISATYQYGVNPSATEVRVSYAPKSIKDDLVVYDNTRAENEKLVVDANTIRTMSLKFSGPGKEGGEKLAVLELSPINEEAELSGWEHTYNLREGPGRFEPTSLMPPYVETWGGDLQCVGNEINTDGVTTFVWTADPLATGDWTLVITRPDNSQLTYNIPRAQNNGGKVTFEADVYNGDGYYTATLDSYDKENLPVTVARQTWGAGASVYGLVYLKDPIPGDGGSFRVVWKPVPDDLLGGPVDQYNLRFYRPDSPSQIRVAWPSATPGNIDPDTGWYRLDLGVTVPGEWRFAVRARVGSTWTTFRTHTNAEVYRSEVAYPEHVRDDDPRTLNDREDWPAFGRYEPGRGWVATDEKLWYFDLDGTHPDWPGEESRVFLSRTVRGVALRYDIPRSYNIAEVEVTFKLTIDPASQADEYAGLRIFNGPELLYTLPESGRDTRVRRVKVPLDGRRVTDLSIVAVCYSKRDNEYLGVSGTAEIQGVRLVGAGSNPFRTSSVVWLTEELGEEGAESGEYLPGGVDVTGQIEMQTTVNAKSVDMVVRNPLPQGIRGYVTLVGKGVLTGESIELWDQSEVAHLKYNKRIVKELENSLWATQEHAKAALYHDLNWRRRYLGFVSSLTLRNREVKWWERQLDYKLGDVIQINDPDSGVIDRKHIVKAVDYHFARGVLDTTYKLQPIPLTPQAVVGFAVVGVDRIISDRYETHTGIFNKEL